MTCPFTPLLIVPPLIIPGTTRLPVSAHPSSFSSSNFFWLRYGIPIFTSIVLYIYIYMIIEMETENSFLNLIRLNNKRRRFPPPERTYLVTVTLQFNRSPDVGSRIMSSRDGSNLFPISENQVVRRPMCVKPCLMPHYT